MAATAGAAAGPIAEFCAALRQLRADSGRDPRLLARQLSISRTQLYAILNGEIKRPPDWARFVGPLVAACTGGDDRALADWRRRHAVLVEVCAELNRQRRQGKQGKQAGPATGQAKPAGPIATARPDEGAAKDRKGPVPRQLPAHTPYFVGRTQELGRERTRGRNRPDPRHRRDGGHREDRAGLALGPSGGRPVPRRAALRQPAGVRPGPAAGGAGRRRSRLPGGA